jgi:hypothetical protein
MARQDINNQVIDFLNNNKQYVLEATITIENMPVIKVY